MHRGVVKKLVVLAALMTVVLAVSLDLSATASGAVDTRTPTASPSSAPVDRVLVISLPHVAWRDITELALPNLDRLVAESAIADVTNRTIGKRDLASSYLTIGAGTRAGSTGLPDDGLGLQADEPFGTITAAEAMRQRTGSQVSSGIVQLGTPAIIASNDEQDVDVTVGALGDALAHGGWNRAVVGNGDGMQVDRDVVTYRRFAVNALMGASGIVPSGRVDDTLNEPDAAAPFGEQANLDRTVAAFRAAWQPRTVALVEASDLARVGDAVPTLSAKQRTQLFRHAMERADELVGRLLESVDPAHDAVIVLGTGPSNNGDSLTIGALRAPRTQPGLLRSASTRRNGFVLLADVAPTILDITGLPKQKDMSGSPFTVKTGNRDDVQRRAYLISESKAGAFRDRVRGPVVLGYTILEGVLVVGAMFVLMRRRGPRARALVRFGALVALGFVPAVYLARRIAFQDHGTALFGLALVATALVLGALFWLLGRRMDKGPLMLALAGLVVLQIGDVLTGARLQFGSAFGYSATIGVRVSGLGNISYSFLSAAALLLAGLVAHRLGGRRGAYVAIAILAVAMVVDIAPFWGADFGGILSMVPAFGVMGALLLGIRIRVRLRTVMIAGLATFVVLVVMAAIDLSRPTNEQTHVGRLISSIGDNGPDKLFSVIGRKLDQNIVTLTNSDWRPNLVIGLLFLAFLAWSHRKWLDRIMEHTPEYRATLIGFGLLAFLGYALNDSGVAIPAAMFTVLNATLAFMATSPELHDARPTDEVVPPEVVAAEPLAAAGRPSRAP
jgi:hypothetical protein